MPYKIYTYEDPYQLDKADFWGEISALPHFCSARTLVNGFKDVLGDSIQGLICPLDVLVEHDNVYKQWTDNISLRVHQYSALSATFKMLVEQRKISKPFHMALTQNQNHFLEALRLFIELDINASALDSSKGNTEQKLFVYMLRKAQKNKLFSFPDTPNKEKLKQIICSIAKKEVEECTGTQQEKKRCQRAVKITKEQPLDAIVVHGIHQFSPVQLRLILSMEKMGITIIFLFNYQKKFSKIYSSWNDIYGCFETPIHHDTVIKEYKLPTMQNPSNALACALGNLCEDQRVGGSQSLRKWSDLYKKIELLEFANITEYAHFVSNHFDNAIRRYSESRSVMQRGNNVWSNAGVLWFLDEQVYTANRDVHKLLKIYYPEYAKDRHFLSYPIGQFFSSIYRLWDYERGQISIDIGAIKECLSSNILRAAPGEELLRTFYTIQILFEHISTFDEFKKEIAENYAHNYDAVSKAPGSSVVSELKSLSIYNKYIAPKKDIQALIQAIVEINEIATYLFSIDNTREDYINFGKHFHNLEEFLKQRELDLANEQERALINALQLRLDHIKPEKTSFSGTFHDLKEGLHYYLKQKDDDDQGVDWIVKNFEQIDGDILQSKAQFEREQHKVYHFACVSDRDMNMTVNDQLPWPLTDEYIRVAYSPIDLQFQVYYTAIGERSSFLRYALFYGLCYNCCETRLSYVKQYDNETTEPYALLAILGLLPKSTLIERLDTSARFTVQVEQEKTKGIRYDRIKMMDMFLCPYRFFLDYVTGNSPVMRGNFLYQKFYENIIIETVWKRIQNQNRKDAIKYLSRIIDAEAKSIDQYVGFWKPTELYDLKQRANNYLLHEIITDGQGNSVKPYDPTHMQIRKLFGSAKFVVDISETEQKNPYESFERLAIQNGWKKEYSLHRLPLPEAKDLADTLRNEAKTYINQDKDKDKSALPSDWCTYCVHKGICMEPFLSSEISSSTSRTESNRRKKPHAFLQKGIEDIAHEETSGNNAADIDVENSELEKIIPEELSKPSFEMPAHAETVENISKEDNTKSEESRLSEVTANIDFSSFEQLLKSIHEMVTENSQEIQALKNDMAEKQRRREDTTRIEARLKDEENRSQELLSKLVETEGKLASTKEENRALTQTVQSQKAIINKDKVFEFSDEELNELHRFTTLIIFDTCSIMDCPNLLDGVNDGELVVVPKEVNNELEHHKGRYGFDERKVKAQRGITAIFNYKKRFPLIYADASLDLIPDAYRAERGEKELNDNKILSVAIRYKKYTNVPVLFITDDRSLANKAEGESIEVWSSRDFLNPPQREFDETSNSSTNSDANRVEDDNCENLHEEKNNNSTQAKEQFLAQKISTKVLKLDSKQIDILRNNGVLTVLDFMNQTEQSFASMKVKKGMPFTARYLDVQESLKKKLQSL